MASLRGRSSAATAQASHAQGPGGSARAALLLLLLTACIERPAPSGPAPVRQIDRSALSDVLAASVPADAVPVGAVFAGAAELAAYKTEPPQLVPGQRFRLTLYWRCRTALEAWHVFVHLDDPSGGDARIHAEHDPAGGRYPTDAWRPGDLVADSVMVTAGRTPLALYLGFFSNGENRLQLDSPGRGRDDGNNRLFAGLLQLAR
jgi:hypothetical protein